MSITYASTLRVLQRIELLQSSEGRIALQEQLARDVEDLVGKGMEWQKRAEAAEAQLASCRPDASLFSMIRSIVAFGKGCFLLKDGDRIIIGEPTETICYGKLGEGCDEREAVRVAYENMMKVPPCERERVKI